MDQKLDGYRTLAIEMAKEMGIDLVPGAPVNSARLVGWLDFTGEFSLTPSCVVKSAPLTESSRISYSLRSNTNHIRVINPPLISFWNP
jgi:hypothetical protein